jgi:hypothetical protein
MGSGRKEIPLRCLAGFLLVLAFGAAGARASTCTEDLNSSVAFGGGSAARVVAAIERGVSAPGAGGPRAGTANAGITGKVIIQELAKGALQAGGSLAAGYVFEQIGLGTPDYSAQLSRLENEIRAANIRLDQLAGSVSELQGVVSQSGYSNLVGQAVPIISKIKYAQGELALLSTETNAGRKRGARAILDYVCTNLLDKQTELGERLVGTAPTADNLITSSSKAARDSVRYWTDAQSSQVRQVLAYYVEYEALLLQLRVEWWHAIGASRNYVVAQIDKVKRDVQTQDSLLKPDIARPKAGWERGQHYFVDVKHPGLVWWPVRVYDVLPAYKPDHVTFLEQQAGRYFGGSWDSLGLQPFNVYDFTNYGFLNQYRGGWRFGVHKPGENPFSEGVYGVGVLTAAPDRRPDSPLNDGFEWAPPTLSEVQSLIGGWQASGSPLAYLRAGAKPPLGYSLSRYQWGTTVTGQEVIWARTDGACCHFKVIDLRNGSVTDEINPNSREAIAGLFAVRPADPRGYWY